MERRDHLQGVLTSAFEVDELLRFATERLAFDDVKIADEVNFNQGKSQVVFRLVEACENYGHLPELVLAIREARPARPDVKTLVEVFDLVVAAAMQPVTAEIPAVVHDAVIRFNAKFEQRQEQIGYLNANKKLHDLLHRLQDFQAQIESTVAAIRRPAGEAPDRDGILDPLTLWVAEGEASVKETEFPNLPRHWIVKFRKAVNDLVTELSKSDTAAIEVAQVNRAVEILAHLPAQEQKNLNTLLVEYAMRLKTDELVDLIDRVLIELGKAGVVGEKTDDLRARVGSFRIVCRSLTDLIAEHNLCQDVEGALAEAEGLPADAPEQLTQWTEIKGWLQEIAMRHPGSLADDLRARRPFESACQFEEAIAAGDKAKAKMLFQRLEERFAALFLKTDEALLTITQELLASARMLDATLRRFDK
jgi:hypothetical protein